MGDKSKMNVYILEKGTEISETGESSRLEGRSKMEERSEVDEGSEVKRGSETEVSKVQTDKFFLADKRSKWYEHLSRGRCDELLCMLKENPLLLRQKGKGNVTVLHKAVHQGHLELVQYVIEKMFDDKGLSAHSENQLTLEDLLCEKNDREITAVMLAAMIGPWEGIHIFNRAIETCDNYQKTEADELDPTDNQTNCSGIVGDYRVNELEMPQTKGFSEYPAETLEKDQAARLEKDPAARLEKDPAARLKKDPAARLKKDPAASLIGYPHVLRATFERFRTASRMAVERPDVRNAISEYQDVIEPIVKVVLNENDDDIIDLKGAFERRDDYNSVRIEEFFFHFLCGCCEIRNDSGYSVRWKRSAARVAQKIVNKIMDLQGDSNFMYDLFDHVDPQGRTPLHVAGMAGYEVHNDYKFSNCGIIAEVLELIPKEQRFDRCVNVRDGAGRTIFHQACILKSLEDWHQIINNGRVNLDARVDLDARVEWDASYYPCKEKKCCGPLVHRLLHWRSPRAQYNFLQSSWLQDIPQKDPVTEYSNFYPTALHLLILHGHEDMLKLLLNEVNSQRVDVNARLWRGSWESGLTPVQLAAALGHNKMVEMLLKHKEVKDNGKLHGPHDESDKYSAIHVAAAYKRLKVLQTILENKRIYDPLITTTSGEQESPLHYVALTRKLPDPIMLEDLLLEGDMDTVQRCLHKYKDFGNESLQKNHDANDIVCINVMLQVGFDIWSGDKDGREPYPGVDASIEAYKWWYARVADEVLSYRQKLNSAMAAISVIAALVATASFIGPLQPPLGYDGVDGYVQSSYALIRVYFICNGLSFYIVVASILAAVTPAIPMLRESTRDEIRRSQRTNKIATSLLLVSIVGILIGFSCSSIVVMRPFYGDDREMMFYTVGVGATICVVILVLFSMRSISQILDETDLFKLFKRAFYLPVIRIFLISKLKSEIFGRTEGSGFEVRRVQSRS